MLITKHLAKNTFPFRKKDYTNMKKRLQKVWRSKK